MRQFYLLLTSICLSLLVLSCQDETQSSDTHLGEIELQITGSEEAQQAFERGLLLLHSFEYADSREAFQQARELDPACAMAYWGEAMTHNHNLWSQQDYEKGTEALANMDKQCDLTKCSALEQDLIASTKVLYGEGEKVARDQAYAEEMAKLYAAYPGNHEVAAFYALSLLGSVPMGRDVSVYEKGATIAQGIIEENPNHPGALHYLIHSYDDPQHAFMALNAANSYSKVAPDAAHALHMPSHIYVALGMWDEVVSSNIASYNASVNRMTDKGLTDNARSYHALAWLQYGQLQKGNLAEAEKIMQEKTSYLSEEADKRSRVYQIEMTGTYLAALDAWDAEWADFDVKNDDLNIVAQALFDFIKGMKAYAIGDEAELTETIRQMGLKRETASKQLDERGLSMCAAVTRQAPNQLQLDRARIMEMELQAQLHRLQGNSELTEKWLKDAVALESSISYAYGPPEVVKPSWEMYGDWLMSANRPQEAASQYAQALQRTPKRTWVLDNLRQAYAQLNMSAKADSLEQVISEIQMVEGAQASVE
ncbi:MAG: hypothetical protein AAF587_05260 [Bacteroidota bacterium]